MMSVVKFSKAERTRASRVARRVACPYCNVAPGVLCRRHSKDGHKYSVWESHTARMDAYLLTEVFIIEEEQDVHDLVSV